MTGPYKAVTIQAPTAARIEKALNEMAEQGYVLHSQPLILTHTKIATASVIAIFYKNS